MIYQHRVIFGDTDQMGVVYYGNYMRYFEASRAAYLRHVGKSGKWLEEVGIGFPVVEAHCRYHKPAFFEDLIDVEVRVSELRAASLVFSYRLARDECMLAQGSTRHACTGQNGRPTRIPNELVELIRAEEPAIDSGARAE